MKADLTVNEMIVFRIRVGFLKSQQPNMDELNYDKIEKEQSNYGHKIEIVVPCLRPDLTAKEMHDENQMSQRYYEDLEMK